MTEKGFETLEMFLNNTPDINNIPGGTYSEELLDITLNLKEYNKLINDVTIFNNVISKKDINKLKDFFEKLGTFEPVTVQGMDYNDNSEIGSHRITAYLPLFAESINRCILNQFSHTFIADDYTSTDWWQGDKLHKNYELVGISPMFRYMRYDKGGKHYAHYDAGYIYDNPYNEFRTLYSFVFYLTTNTSGATRFIHDGQENTKIWNRNHDDWNRETNEDEVICKSYPKEGKLIIFPHRMCHDVEEFIPENNDEKRIIIRGDVLFKQL